MKKQGRREFKYSVCLFRNRNRVCGLDRPQDLTPFSQCPPNKASVRKEAFGHSWLCCSYWQNLRLNTACWMVDGRITLPMCRGICDFPRTWAQRTFSTVMAVCFPPHLSPLFLLILPIYRLREPPSSQGTTWYDMMTMASLHQSASWQLLPLPFSFLGTSYLVCLCGELICRILSFKSSFYH